ncbi:hypothetical protein [Parasedimentitalea maritima]|nr:hypothetical protein [Zongyanglinia marina]
MSPSEAIAITAGRNVPGNRIRAPLDRGASEMHLRTGDKIPGLTRLRGAAARNQIMELNDH